MILLRLLGFVAALQSLQCALAFSCPPGTAGPAGCMCGDTCTRSASYAVVRSSTLLRLFPGSEIVLADAAARIGLTNSQAPVVVGRVAPKGSVLGLAPDDSVVVDTGSNDALVCSSLVRAAACSALCCFPTALQNVSTTQPLPPASLSPSSDLSTTAAPAVSTAAAPTTAAPTTTTAAAVPVPSDSQTAAGEAWVVPVVATMGVVILVLAGVVVWLALRKARVTASQEMYLPRSGENSGDNNDIPLGRLGNNKNRGGAESSQSHSSSGLARPVPETSQLWKK